MTFSHAESTACRQLVDLALAEDLGTFGDRTSLSFIPEDRIASAVFIARTSGILAGVPAIELVAATVDPTLELGPLLEDGSALVRGTRIATISGSLRAILAVERTALNFTQHLSGIASLTRTFVDAVAGLPVQILDTRKTLPAWRLLEKYAVRMGGGTNHRLGLYDGILIKDNHLAGIGEQASAVRQAVRQARSQPHNAGIAIEVEVDTLTQLEEALAEHADIVLLDNMCLHELRTAVSMRNRSGTRTLLEASGGVTLTTVRAIAETGVDRISIGALTHSATALDIALDYES